MRDRKILSTYPIPPSMLDEMATAVEHGHYESRAELVRTGIRKVLDEIKAKAKETMASVSETKNLSGAI